MPKLSPHARFSGRHVADNDPEGAPRGKRGPKPRPIVEFPEPLFDNAVDPTSFSEAFAFQLERHGDSCWHLHRALMHPDETFDRKTFKHWAAGTKRPNTIVSFEMLARVERRYRLPGGYFRDKLERSGRAPRRSGHLVGSPSEHRRLAWHLPDDFEDRPAAEREDILNWVRTVIISGSTDYRRYHAEAIKVRYSLRFPVLTAFGTKALPQNDPAVGPHPDETLLAPLALVRELGELVEFKTATLARIGLKRSGVWNEETVSQKIEHLGLMFGALVADPDSPVSGLGVPRDDLCMALLAIPAVWDWYLHWREARRGFYTAWEVNMLELSTALTRRQTGWLRQNPQFALRLQPITGLVGMADIDRARTDWDGLCDASHAHTLTRTKEIGRIARVHRDPFEPILPILEDESPVGAYRKITAEIIREMPDVDRYPRAAAEAVRGFLMLRLGLHLGVRQKNLRQLLVGARGTPHRTERQLEGLRRGELHWNARDQGWEVLIPSIAFKNANSSFFGKRPFRLLLPDFDGLYAHIDAYLARHRLLLLNGAADPGTFFVKTVKRTSSDASYNSAAFYEAWRLMIQRYGIYNPFTGRGAIKGLLPHGPHNVRDVLATHILKRTGSYEQASYAIQDTPEMVAKHYGRFLPQDKAALAARILNQVWEN
ncbi:hypothetical protein [Sphingomonas qomolangmaensis]|uniref:Integrase n=1 Tax=Sphingomonas qomolangmaensis TaxID=2918765 RepID=A0ABY5L8X5_9SPHN|nr:hypothetical protein [Sphingomonas qomolangmaensis]UUL82596.1 hypothetical protein NMP03_15720 [Sphingomonas qomolangmaensis]